MWPVLGSCLQGGMRGFHGIRVPGVDCVIHCGRGGVEQGWAPTGTTAPAAPVAATTAAAADYPGSIPAGIFTIAR